MSAAAAAGSRSRAAGDICDGQNHRFAGGRRHSRRDAAGLREDADAGGARLRRRARAQIRGRARRLLARRAEIQHRLDAGWKPDFLAETKAVRDGDWRVAPIPRDIADRRVEITGPVDRKMVINALNCGASVYMADFEDANTPTWDNLIEGQANLCDAVRRDHHLRRSRDRPALHAERQDCGAVRAPARLASARKACAGRRRADVGRAVRFRPVLLPQRQGIGGARHRALFLSAQDREPSRGAAVERRVRRMRRRRSACPRARSARRC